MSEALQNKLEKVVELIDNALVYPDIDLSYEMPEEDGKDPYIVVNYKPDGMHAQQQKIPLKKVYLEKTPEDIAGLVTFHIEQFMEEIDSVNYGAQ